MANSNPVIRVVSLGTFAGGSFGAGGNPSKVYEMWAVVCPRNSGAFPACGFVFCDRGLADAGRLARPNTRPAGWSASARWHGPRSGPLPCGRR